jgi:CrcB protein
MGWLLVGFGGALGSMLRHGMNGFVQARLPDSTFPLGIFLVNIAGSTLIGVLAGLLASARVSMSEDSRLFLVVGIFGGFTTFSSFSLDTLALVRDGHHLQAVVNVAGQVGLSLLGVWAGFKIAQ